MVWTCRSVSILTALLLGAVFLFEQRPQYVPYEQPYPMPKEVRYLTAGHQTQLADLLWLRFLQISDFCENNKTNVSCSQKSVIYQNLDLATDLDPTFEAGIYRVGGLALSVLMDDIEGATLFFDKGLKQYPNYWPLLYSAAYHAQFEEKNIDRASQFYARAAQNGAPDWVSVLAGRLAVDAGNSDFARKVLQTMIDTNQDENLINRLKEKMKALTK